MGALGQFGPVLIRFGAWSLETRTVQLKWQKACLRLPTFLQIQAHHREEEYCLPVGLFLQVNSPLLGFLWCCVSWTSPCLFSGPHSWKDIPNLSPLRPEALLFLSP